METQIPRIFCRQVFFPYADSKRDIISKETKGEYATDTKGLKNKNGLKISSFILSPNVFTQSVIKIVKANLATSYNYKS